MHGQAQARTLVADIYSGQYNLTSLGGPEGELARFGRFSRTYARIVGLHKDAVDQQMLFDSPIFFSIARQLTGATGMQTKPR